MLTLAHYWEDVSFGKEDNADYKLQFASQVTNFLKSGFKAPKGPGNLHIFSFHVRPIASFLPRKECQSREKYRPGELNMPAIETGLRACQEHEEWLTDIF